MLIAVTDSKAIRVAQKTLEGRLAQSLLKRTGVYTIGYQGGSREVRNLRADQRIWFIPQVAKASTIPRYWNAFGMADRLNLRGSNDIVVEVNIPLGGPSARVAGLFARDSETGHLILLHRGSIGGGRKGVGKEAFLNWYRQPRVAVSDGSSSSTALKVADIDAPNASHHIADFVEAVFRFKSQSEVEEIAGLSDSELERRAGKGRTEPKRTAVESLAISRNAYVAEYAKRRARGNCDLCTKRAPFSDEFGAPYLECHHVEWLAHGGPDTINNAVALCPNCHRKIHILKDERDVETLRVRARKRIASAA